MDVLLSLVIGTDNDEDIAFWIRFNLGDGGRRFRIQYVPERFDGVRPVWPLRRIRKLDNQRLRIIFPYGVFRANGIEGNGIDRFEFFSEIAG